MRVYISGPLQAAADLDSARALYERLAVLVSECGHEAYVPHHNTDPRAASHLSPAAVFSADMRAMEACDAVIAHIGAPSTGVGAELALAVAAGRPVLGLKRPEESASRFAEGLLDNNGDQVSVFDSESALADAVRRWLVHAFDANNGHDAPGRHRLAATA